MNDIAPAGIGHNEPPLAEVLAEQVKPLAERRDTLLANLRDSQIASQEDAEKVTTLGVMLKELRDRAEAARKEAARPFDEGKATVQRLYARDLLDPLDSAMTTARTMLNTWRRQQEAAAEAERRKRDEEAAAARAAADKLAQEKRDAEAANDPSRALKAELAEIQARDRAEALEGEEGTIRPGAVLHVNVGAAVTTTHVTAKIDNVGQFLAWLIRNDSKWLSETLQPRADRLIRSKLAPDGVSRVETSGTSFRR